jgi:hypothetical protein
MTTFQSTFDELRQTAQTTAAAKPQSSSPAARLFGAGVSTALGGGELGAAAGSVVKRLFSRVPRPERGPQCVIDLNPSDDAEIAAVYASAFEKEVGRWSYGVDMENWGRGTIELKYLGTLMRCVGELPTPCSYTFDEWNKIVDGFDPEAMGYEAQTKERRGEGMLFSDPYTVYVSSDPYRLWALSWKVLPLHLRRRRYDALAQECARLAVVAKLTGEEKAALESYLGGRFVDEQFLSANQTHSLFGPVDRIPRWVPLESDAENLAREYMFAWTAANIDDLDMVRISQLDEQPLARFAMGSASDRRKLIARMQNIAAASAQGDADAYDVAKKSVDTFARSIGVEPYSIDPSERKDAWQELKRVAAVTNGMKVDAFKTAGRWFGAIIAGVAIAGVTLWALKKRGR